MYYIYICIYVLYIHIYMYVFLIYMQYIYVFLIYMQYIYTVSPACESEKAKVQVPQSCLTVCDPMNYMYSPWNSPGQNTGVGSLYFLQGIFPTQGSNPGLLHCIWILYQLSCQGSSIHLQCIHLTYTLYCQYSMLSF